MSRLALVLVLCCLALGLVAAGCGDDDDDDGGGGAAETTEQPAEDTAAQGHRWRRRGERHRPRSG